MRPGSLSSICEPGRTFYFLKDKAMSKSFCIESDCGVPCEGTRCTEHQTVKRRRSYARESKYYSSNRWKAFSRKLRAKQPWCDWEVAPGVLCQSGDDLVCDHATPEAYTRQAAALPFRESDFRILCRTHNGQAGSPGDRL